MSEVKQNGLQMPHAFFFNPPIFSHFIGHQMAEVYKDSVYDRYVAGKKDLTILDIGANIGITAYYFQHFGKVYAVEPSQEHFNLLSTMIKFNHLEDKIIPINKAIDVKNGNFTLYHPKNKTTYSLHSGVAKYSQSQETVEAITLDKLFEDNKIDHVDILKLDVEGSEYEILAGEGFEKVAPKIDLIIGETHDWVNRHPRQLVDALENNGFKFEVIPNEASLFVARK